MTTPRSAIIFRSGSNSESFLNCCSALKRVKRDSHNPKTVPSIIVQNRMKFILPYEMAIIEISITGIKINSFAEMYVDAYSLYKPSFSLLSLEPRDVKDVFRPRSRKKGIVENKEK